MRDRVEINKNLVPYTFEMLLGGEVWSLRIDYNSVGDMFTVSLYKDDVLIHANEPLIYGVSLWRNCYVCGKYPPIDIIPWDDSGGKTAVTWDNLDETVFLMVDNQAQSILE